METANDKTAELSSLSKEEIESLEKNVQFHVSRLGNQIAYHEYGDPLGAPIFYYHGTGSHINGMLLHRPAMEYGFRIIAPDRPGVAQSDFRKGWTVLEYARDMADLADRLGIGTFGVIGLSGGGPTLMASAFAIPERLRYVVDLACAMPVYADPEMNRHLGTMDRFYARIGARLPLALFRIPFSLIGWTQTLFRSPKMFAKMFSSSLCPADKQLFTSPDLQYLLMRDFQELFRQGATPAAYDALTVYKPWGFNLSDISIPVKIFHGTADKFVPPSFSEYLARNAKNATLHLIEGQGHFYHVAYGCRTMKTIKETFYP
jgi:pimeloyl-ACP methyl ester carboxylesterase